MIRRRIVRSSAILASSLASIIPHGVIKADDGKLTKKLRESVLAVPGLGNDTSVGTVDPPWLAKDRYPWRTGINTTTFWIGETPTKNNPTPNHASSWDAQWARNFGGFDDPENRSGFLPAKFTPRQNPFYVALPYNDVTRGKHKPEASKIIPWFKEAFEKQGKSVLKGRWIAIRYKGKVAYAQWEDCGPFRTDHWQYVFGDERPKPNLNKGAGLDVSPAVRDFLGMKSSDVTDWRFVDFDEVPTGPWAVHGDNNTFVMNKRQQQDRVAMAKAPQAVPRQPAVPAAVATSIPVGVGAP